jgi:2-amino-4-hydroxy-6-hydroxymethyldihydropteridine diphosphokinase
MNPPGDPPPALPAGIALGSNLGDRLGILRAAAAALEPLHVGPGPMLRSPVHETDPVDCPPGSPPFLNAVVEIVTPIDPLDLLDRLAAIEAAAGRPSDRARNAPRPLDLDLLYVGDATRRSPRLDLPHPRLHERRFVLEPLAAIRPDFRLPGLSVTVAERLAQLPPGNPPRIVAATL